MTNHVAKTYVGGVIPRTLEHVGRYARLHPSLVRHAVTKGIRKGDTDEALLEPGDVVIASRGPLAESSCQVLPVGAVQHHTYPVTGGCGAPRP